MIQLSDISMIKIFNYALNLYCLPPEIVCFTATAIGVLADCSLGFRFLQKCSCSESIDRLRLDGGRDGSLHERLMLFQITASQAHTHSHTGFDSCAFTNRGSFAFVYLRSRQVVWLTHSDLSTPADASTS